MTNETQKTRFFQQLKLYGFGKILKSVDFIVALAVLITVFIDQLFKLSIFNSGNSDYVIAIFAAASTLFAITIATLAIILSFSSNEFMLFLKRNKKLSPLLFLFWLGNAVYLFVILLSVIYLLLNSNSFELIRNLILYPVIVSLFIYALIDTFYILGAVVRFGYFLDLYDSLKNQEDIK